MTSPESYSRGLSAAPFGSDFNSARPIPLGAESISLGSLVYQQESIAADLSLEMAYAVFRERKVDFMAVVRDGRVIGLSSRGQIGFVMGSRFGFALYSDHPVEQVMVPNPLVIFSDLPVREALVQALGRTGTEFHEDAVLIDRAARLVGLIRAESFAQLQSRLVAEQMDALQRQHDLLREQNLELFRASHAVRQSHGLYLGLFQGHTLGIALLDADGAVHEHNRRLAEILGFGDETASMVSLAAWVEESERSSFLALLQHQASGGAVPATREFTLNIPGRGPRIFRCSTGWIKETGQICACLDDVTDQRTLERKLLRQEKQTLLDTLVGGIAHELNNKLTPVQGYAELLSIGAKGEAVNYASYINKCVDEAAHIIRQLLQLSKPSVPVVQLVDLRRVVDETLLMLRFQLREVDCELRSILPGEPAWVMGDAAQLKQVGINLLLNGLQALDGRVNPTLTVEVRIEGASAMLAVTDNGCGIPAENLGRIFDPFFTTKGPERGTGLGLSICYSIVRQHGGDIAVSSRPGAGACFTITLPRERAAPLFALDPAPAEVTAARPRDQPRGQRVLVVEDEDVVRNLLQEMLRTRFDCEVDLASNGVEALATLERGDYALVISDVQMPVMNGPELYLRVREQQPAVAARFIFITGYSGGRVAEAEIAQWKVPILAKPFTLTKLSSVCRPFLDVVGETRVMA